MGSLCKLFYLLKIKKRLFVPKGFAHGFYVLSENATIKYMVDNFYSPAHDKGIFYKDAKLKIKIPQEKIKISERDKNFPMLKEACLFDFKY